MVSQNMRIFNAIASFVQDLDAGCGKKYKPVALYNRLVSKTTEEDTTCVEKHITAFKNFFSSNNKYITTKNLTTNARITYSKKVYLDVGKITSRMSKEDHTHIHRHLVTIYSLINAGTEEGLQALEELKKSTPEPTDGKKSTDFDLDNIPDTTEGKFIKDTLTEMTEHFDNMGGQENPDPMAMMANMMQSGFFQKFMGDLQSKFSNGEMNIQSLMGTVTNVIEEATPEGQEEAAQIRNFVNQSMGQISSMGGDGQLPPDLLGQMGGLLGAMGGGSNAQPPLADLLGQMNTTVDIQEEPDPSKLLD